MDVAVDAAFASMAVKLGEEGEILQVLDAKSAEARTEVVEDVEELQESSAHAEVGDSEDQQSALCYSVELQNARTESVEESRGS